MRAPVFWYRPSGVVASLLSPIGALYAWATARRISQAATYTARVPVICVGNINVGGTGKTPTVIALAQLLQARGKTPAIISRGYGGSLAGPLEVMQARHSASDVGDEPLLMSAFARVWVGRDRAAAARMAEASGADAIIMDDGHQNPSVARDLSVVVADARRGFGNGHCIPAGPLREPVAVGLKRADLLLSIGSRDAQKRFAQEWKHCLSLPHMTAQLEPLETGMDWQGTRFLAFAGIGDPEKFFSTLKSLGADVTRSEALEDHQELSPSLMNRLENEAALLNAQLVTTEKDAVRLPKDFRGRVLALPVRLQFSDTSLLDARLDDLGL